MPTLRANEYTFAYVEDGAGDPVVLVHGSVNDHRSWQAQIPAFATTHRTLAYSRRFHWPNEPNDGADYSMNEHVNDLRAVVQTLEAAPAHIIGHSYGGFLTLLLAIRSPELVRSLVLMEPPVLPLFTSNPPKPPELLKLLLTRPATAMAVIKFGATGIGPATAAFKRGDIDAGIRHFGHAVLGRETFDAMPKERMERVRANFVATEFLGSGFAPLEADDVRNLHVPVLLVGGARSPAIFRHFTDRLEELLPHVQRIEIADASHSMAEDNPDEFNAKALAFLRSV